MLVAALAATSGGCAPDPPAAVVGIITDGCIPGNGTGSGVVVGDGLVLTSAHVLAGADAIEVIQSGRRSDATIVAFDPEMDLAYLRVDGLRVRPLAIGSDHVEAGDTGTAYVVRDGEVVDVAVRVRRRVRIRTEDIYVEGETVRPGFELDGDIVVGDSGGAIVVGGEVVGVVWARSRRFDGRAYAIDPTRAGELVAEQLATGRIGPDVDVTRCR